MARIFVCYRRQDSAGHAGRLYDRLRAFFGSSRVFMDVEGIDLGADFTQVLDERIAGAEVVVAVIGPKWLAAAEPGREPRIRSAGDYVRRELATALGHHVEVIPVLVAGAEVPGADDLPEELAELAGRQMFVVGDGAFDAGMARLIKAVERSAARTRERRRLAPRPRPQFSRRLLARLLLLYEPVRPATWVLHILFFAALVVWVTSPILAWTLATGVGGRATRALQALASSAVLPLALRAIVLLLEPDPVVSPLRRWLLLYNPPRVTIAALHVLFLLMASLSAISLIAVLELARIQTGDLDRAVPVQSWMLLMILTFVVREIGASNDPVRPVLSPPNWFARLFCIWKPRRGLAWLPRLLYYGVCLGLLVQLPRALTDSGGNFGSVNRGALAVTALLAALAVSARGFACAIEVDWPGDRARGLARFVKRSLLLEFPWRRSGWAAAAFLWLGLGTLVALATSTAGAWSLPGIDPERRLPLSVMSMLLVVCAWGWGQLYRPPFKWTEPEADATSQRFGPPGRRDDGSS